MPHIEITINGTSQSVPAGTTVAAALVNAAVPLLRRSVTGEPRAPLCGMGICMECRVTINQQSHQRACMVECQPGMQVHTDA